VPTTIGTVTCSPRKRAPQRTPNTGTTYVTDIAFAGPTLRIRRK
jgi:hypothetical protein